MGRIVDKKILKCVLFTELPVKKFKNVYCLWTYLEFFPFISSCSTNCVILWQNGGSFFRSGELLNKMFGMVYLSQS